MNNSRFYRNLSIIFLALAGLAYIISESAQFTLVHYTFWYTNLFFFVVIGLGHLISSTGLKNISDFHMFYFASMGIRFFLSLIYIFCFVFFGVSDQLTFVFNFMFLYLLYTAFEIYTLISNLRHDFKK